MSAPADVRLRHRRRWLRGQRARQPALLRPRYVGPGARGRPQRQPARPVHPHAGRPALPDRQPALRLEVRVGARALHGRPQGLPRARQGARRLQQHQRDDLPARQPARLRALGGRRGMASWDYAHCLPYFKRMETCLAGADQWRGGSGPLVLERGPATSPLFGAFFEAVQQAGHPLTDDVNGYRQEGFAPFDRNVHRGRRLSAARAYLHPVMGRENLAVQTLALVTGLTVKGNRVTGVDYHRDRPRRPARRRPRGDPVRRRDQLTAAAAALRHRPEGRPRAARHRRGGRPARRRRQPPGPPRGLHPVRLQAAGVDRPLAQAPPQAARSAPSGCSCAAASGRPTTSRPAASSAATTASTTPT